MLGKGVIDDKLPYVGIDFALITGDFTIGQIVPDRYFKSGIYMYAKACSDNKKLKQEIDDIFGKVVNNILKWEKEQGVFGKLYFRRPKIR